MRNRRRRRLTFSLLTVVLSGFLGLVVLEAGLRIVAPSSDHYFIWPPYIQIALNPDPEFIPGVSGPTRFRVNSHGLRGDELSKENDYVVLAVGGSATECLALDQTEAWPRLVQQKINQTRKDMNAWVGNAGRSGNSTREHVFQVPHLLDTLPRTDVVLMMVGANDLGHRLKHDQAYDPDFMQRADAEAIEIPRAFSVYPLEHANSLPPYKRTEIYARARTAVNFLRTHVLNSGEVQDDRGESVERWRTNRRNASRIRTDLPDLSTALKEYETNLGRIVDLVTARGVPIVLMTQPTLWKTDLTADEKNLLWWGGIGDFQAEGARSEYYSVAAMKEALERYNRILLGYCGRSGVFCLDLASELPRTTEVFYDDWHFTEYGSELVAELVANFIEEQVLPESR